MGHIRVLSHQPGCTLGICMVHICRGTATTHSQPIQASDYFNMTVRDIMENWQSEFLQLMWQVAGLSFLLYVGSPQSKESSERIEEKIDLIMKKLQERNWDQAEKEQIAR